MNLKMWLIITGKGNQVIIQAERYNINPDGKLEFITNGVLVGQFESYEFVYLKDYFYRYDMLSG